MLTKDEYTDASGRRSLFFIGIVIFFLTGFTALGNGQARQDEWESRDAYVSSGIGDARVLIPFLADDATSSSICALVYNGLTKVDRDLNIVPDLAERWEVDESGLLITFYLRKGVKWHDDAPFTAEDVRFTFETILDPGTGCPYISNYLDIKKIEVLDPHTIRFTYAHLYAPALLKFGMGIIPEHLFSNVKGIRNSPYARAPVGTGPYVFSRWKTGQYIILEANPGYFEHVPGIKRYVYRIIPDQAVQFLELVSEGIDSMDLTPYQFLYRSNSSEFRERLNKYRYLAHSYTYIGYNLKDPLFGDRRVRQALSYAINKREIIDAVLLGLGEPCTGPFLKGTLYYDGAVTGYGHDPEKAAKLLHEAGWKDTDADGVLEKDGTEFRFMLVTNQGNQVREDVATIVQSQWARLGIRSEIQVMAWSAFLDQFVNKKNFQAVLLGWTVPIDPDLYSVWHSDSMVEGGLNFISYSDKGLDRLIEQGRREFDPDRRAEIYREAHGIIAGDAPYTFLFFPYAIPAVQKRFKGIEPAPAGIGYNFIDWYVPEKEVRYR
ncbi:MAG: peptide-binding protein, partial [Candidatus Omnitrophota bacterium]|nr:peptide-binding protein [Candidatus Omnitrophota bacterium]